MKYAPESCTNCEKAGRGKGNYELNGVRFACDCHSVITYHLKDFPVYAATRDLLKACKKLVEVAPKLWGDDTEKYPKIMDRFEQAIAKAEVLDK